MFCDSQHQNIKTDRKYKSVVIILSLAPGYDDIGHVIKRLELFCYSLNTPDL